MELATSAPGLPIEEGYFHGPRKEQVCLGFIWQPLGMSRLNTKDLLRRVRQFSGNHYVMVDTPQGKQLGTFQYPSPRRLEGVHCGAILMQKLLGEDWLGLFEVNENSYWVVGSWKGAFISGLDNLFQNFEEAWARFDMFSNTFAWQRRYVSKGLLQQIQPGQALVEEVDFLQLATRWPLGPSSLVHSTLSPSWLGRLSPRMRKLFLVFLSFSLLLLGGTIWQVQRWRNRQLDLRRAAAQQAAALQRQNVWRNAPSMVKGLELGLEQLRELPLQLKGWRLTGGKWDGKTLSAFYKQVVPIAPPAALQKTVEMQGFSAVFDAQNKSATLARPLAAPPSLPEAKLQSAKTLQGALQKVFRSSRVNGELKALPSPAEGQAAWSLSLSSGLSPESVLEAIALEGLVLQEVSFSLQNGPKILWKLLGKVYAKSS